MVAGSRRALAPEGGWPRDTRRPRVSRHANLIAANDDHLYRLLAWVTFSTRQQCTTRITVSSLPHPGWHRVRRARACRPWCWLCWRGGGGLPRLRDLQPGMNVLDLACGHGIWPIAWLLVAAGSPALILRPRSWTGPALTRRPPGSVSNTVAGDMRQLPWTGRFDRVLNWSTAFGYFDDAANRGVLDGIARVLRPGGRLAMDLDNLTSFLASYCPSRVVAARKMATCSPTATTWTS